MKENEIIPLGSIVKVKQIKDYIMLIGVRQIADGEKYDYSGCVHPYGFLGIDKLLFFNSDQIEEVIFKGYFDDEAKEHYEDIIWLNQNGEDE